VCKSKVQTAALDTLAWKAGPRAKVSRSEIVRAVVRGMVDAADAGAEIPADPAALRSWVARRLASAETGRDA
jgi:hypothetical protein